MQILFDPHLTLSKSEMMVYNILNKQRQVLSVMGFFEEKIDGRTVFRGRVFSVDQDTVRLSDGEICPRDVVVHRGGVGIVPVTDDGEVLMVRQFRYAVGEELLEIPAGKIEDGEMPEECAKRELSEETGCTAGRWVDLGRMYPTPGYCGEVLHIFLATDLTFGEMHPDEGELLSVSRVPLETLYRMIAENRLPDAKSVFGILKTRDILKG